MPPQQQREYLLRLPRVAWPDLAVAGFVLVLGLALFSPRLQHEALVSGDTFMHVRLGQEILRAGRLPATDMLSFTEFGKPYIAHEWGFEVLIAAVHDALGIDGIILLSATLLAALTAFVIRRMQARSASPLSILLVLTLAWESCDWSYRARPHLVTEALFPLGLLWLDSGAWRKRSWRVLALCFVGVAAWTSIHPVSMLFVALLWLELGAAALRDRADARWALAVAAAAGLGVVATPYGLRIPLNTALFLGVPVFAENITEHMPLTYRVEDGGLTFVSMVVAAGYCLAAWGSRRLRAPRLGELLGLVLLGGAAIHSRRWGTLFILAATPTLGLAVDAALSPVRRWGGWLLRSQPARGAPLSDVLWCAGALAAAVAAVEVEQGRISRQAYLEHEEHPVGAAKFIKEHPMLFAGRMFNPYEYGGYLSYILPDHRVFVDGRAELYGPDFLLDSRSIRDGELKAMSLLDKWDIDWAIYRKNAKVGVVVRGAGWRRVYRDDVAEITVRPR